MQVEGIFGLVTITASDISPQTLEISSKDEEAIRTFAASVELTSDDDARAIVINSFGRKGYGFTASRLQVAVALLYEIEEWIDYTTIGEMRANRATPENRQE